MADQVENAVLTQEPEPPSGSVQPAPPRQQLNRREVEALKPVIELLYIEQGMTAAEVIGFLSRNYNYNPTKRQFITLQRRWCLKKNTRAHERQKILEIIDNGVSLDGRVKSILLNTEKLRRWRKELEVNRTITSKSGLKEKYSDDLSWQELSHRQSFMSASRLSLSRQPTCPTVLRTSENLLFSIDTYLDAMIKGGKWDLTDKAIVASGDKSSDLESFLQDSHTAVRLLRAKSFIEARKILSNACESLRSIIKSEHPQTLEYLLIIFETLRRECLVEVLDLIRGYASKLAAIVATHDQWKAIWQLLGNVDTSQLEGLLALLIECVISALGRNLGRLHPLFLEIQMGYLCVKSNGDLEGATIAMNRLLLECEQAPGIEKQKYQLQIIVAHSLVAQGRFVEAKALISISQQFGSQRHCLTQELYALARAHRGLGEHSLAAANLREIAALNIVAQDLRQAVRFLTILYEWYQGWGCLEDAEKLKEEVDHLIEREKTSQKQSEVLEESGRINMSHHW